MFSNTLNHSILQHPDPPERNAGSFKDMLLNIRDDIVRYTDNPDTPSSLVREALMNQGVWATVVYRFGRWTRYRPTLVRIPLRIIYTILKKIIEMTTAIHIDSFAEIGPGLVINHFGPVFIGGNMGANCSVMPGTLVGLGRGSQVEEGRPTIGNRVYLSPGAKILGPITIGDDAAIGPNTVVYRDIPPNAVVLGVPGRIVGWQSSYDNIKYPGRPPVNPALAQQQEQEDQTP